MIEGKFFQNLSRRLGIRAETLERDYVMNLILDAFAHCPSTRDTFFFKGGCCVHKCFSRHTFDSSQPNLSYFTKGRFSSDIDLTVTPEMMESESLHKAFMEVKEYVAERHNLIINQFSFPIYSNSKQKIEDRNKSNCRGIIHYEGPMFNAKFNSPAMKFDITADERVVFTPYKRILYHPYSDQGEEAVLVAKTYTLRDIFAEKIRALFERCSPRDLYDLCILNSHPDMDDYRKIGIGLSIMEKFILKNIDYKVKLDNLKKIGKNGLPLIEDCRLSWNNALRRQVVNLPAFDEYVVKLPEIIEFATECIEKADKVFMRLKQKNENQSPKVVMHNLLMAQQEPRQSFQKQMDEIMQNEKIRGCHD